MAKLNVGDVAPDFKVPASNGKDISLKDYRGKKRVVLYFYPKDDTPGCTTEACGFRDRMKAVGDLDAVVLGVSPDGIKSHDRFIEKFKLPFVLLADEKKEICRKYGVWVMKKLYGREYMGVQRSTFIIGKNGQIEKIYEHVKPDEHPEEVLQDLTG